MAEDQVCEICGGLRQWDGWGTALKPAWEPIIVARKPLEGTVAANVLAHGTGALNIDGCRVGLEASEDEAKLTARSGGSRGFSKDGYVGGSIDGGLPPGWNASKGRWPANLIHDGSDEVVGLFPDSKGMATQKSGANLNVYGGNALNESSTTFPEVRLGFNDTGSAARFFYCAKASKADRDEGNMHPTVKPTALMRYLCKLVTPPAGTVLDPFMGSGSTGKAAVLEGFGFIGIEQDAEYVDIARARIAHAVQSPAQQPLHI